MRRGGDTADHRQRLTLDRGWRVDDIVDDAGERRAHVSDPGAEGIVQFAQYAALDTKMATLNALSTYMTQQIAAWNKKTSD